MGSGAVGLVIAMSAEARAVTGRAQPEGQLIRTDGGLHLYLGGIGDAAAEKSCAALIEAGVGALASLGCAAGLAPESRPGAVVVASEIRVPDGEMYPTDPAWRAAILAGLGGAFRPVVGTIAGVEAAVGRREKRALLARSGAAAADMESAAVARAARRSGLPMMAVRAVSDGPEFELPVGLLSVLDDFGRPRYLPLLRLLLRRPADAAALLRLRSGFSRACDALSRIVAATGPDLCFPGTAALPDHRPCPPPR